MKTSNYIIYYKYVLQHYCTLLTNKVTKYVLNISNKSKPSKLPGDIVNSRLTFVLVSGIWIMI
jgi:hypothetical protein